MSLIGLKCNEIRRYSVRQYLYQYKILNIIKLSVLGTILSSFIYRCRWVVGGV